MLASWLVISSGLDGLATSMVTLAVDTRSLRSPVEGSARHIWTSQTCIYMCQDGPRNVSSAASSQRLPTSHIYVCMLKISIIYANDGLCPWLPVKVLTLRHNRQRTGSTLSLSSWSWTNGQAKCVIAHVTFSSGVRRWPGTPGRRRRFLLKQAV